MSDRFILRIAPGASLGVEEMRVLLQGCDGVQVVDQSSRMLLVEGAHATIDAAVQGCGGWSMSAETHTPLPDPHPRVGGEPKGG